MNESILDQKIETYLSKEWLRLNSGDKRPYRNQRHFVKTNFKIAKSITTKILNNDLEEILVDEENPQSVNKTDIKLTDEETSVETSTPKRRGRPPKNK